LCSICRAAAALAARQVEFEVVVIGRDGLERFDDRGAERRAAKVGVHDDAWAIDDGQDARAAQCVE